LSDGTVIDAGTKDNAARWINHSCDANFEAIKSDEGRIFIDVLRSIRADGELTSVN